ncbi:unnamed protein product [Prunus armeniaca]|uniref:Uncharacterized protein n=1 Tax=Prunus armeniaca TaxID=36596 RepID=A0A6J5UD45_PRUAR|nr:unnamed protein product [Prunus armeniaca]
MVRVITIVLMIVLGVLAPVIGMSLLILHLLPLHHVVIGAGLTLDEVHSLVPPPPILPELEFGPLPMDIPPMSSLKVYRRRRVVADPKKEDDGSHNASSKTNVKRKQLDEVVICGDLLVYVADCVGHKRFCSGDRSNKAKETNLVESPEGPP